MPIVPVRNLKGEIVGEIALSDRVFARPLNEAVIWEAVRWFMAKQRAGTAATKTRGEVSGSGRKPWRQKGTGRARQGSIRAPQWTGGGVAHGPVPRDHAKRVNRKMRRAALRGALSDALSSGKLVVVEELTWDEPRTKRAVEVLEALGLRGRTLLVLPEPSETGAVEKSFRNLPVVRITYAGGLGVYDVLLADHVLVTPRALDVLEGGERR